jgi:hypothetical protein
LIYKSLQFLIRERNINNSTDEYHHDLPRKIYPSKMRVERLKKEQFSHEAKQPRTNRATLAQG